MAPPYLLADWDAFAGPRPWLRRERLCLSRAGREVPCYRAGAEAAAHAVMLTARHHACESSAAWVLEGLLDAWHADAGLRATSRLLIVPLVDLDGVETGDAGKARLPHDHNRDYCDAPIHPETAALQRLAPAWCAGRLSLGLDLHSPWLMKHWNEHLYLVGDQHPEQAREQRRFADLLPDTAPGGLPIGPNRVLPFGVSWNTKPSGRNCSDFFERLGGVGISIETPYAGLRRDGLADLEDPTALVPNGPERLRGLGAAIAGAMARWLSA
jgi:hypothetical protein